MARKCECADRGCKVHRGHSVCGLDGDERVYRIDMEDVAGLLMCIDCAEDALGSGVFALDIEAEDNQDETL